MSNEERAKADLNSLPFILEYLINLECSKGKEPERMVKQMLNLLAIAKVFDSSRGEDRVLFMRYISLVRREVWYFSEFIQWEEGNRSFTNEEKRRDRGTD